MRIWLILLLTVVESLAIASPEAPRELSISDAYSYALQNSPSFQIPRNNREIAELQLKSSKSSFLPSLGLETTNGVRDSNPSVYSNAPWRSDLALSLTENLYDNGESITRYKIAKINLEALKADETAKLNEAALEFTKAYLSHSLNLKLLETQKQQLGLVRKEYASVERQFQQGLKTRFDYLRLRAQRMRSELELIEAETRTKLSREKLLVALGVPIGSADHSNLQIIPISSEAAAAAQLFSLSLEELPAYRRNQSQKKVSALNIDLADQKYGPEFYLTGSLAYLNNDYLHSNQRFNANERVEWSGLLTLKWQLWDWGKRRNDVSVARLTHRLRENELIVSDQQIRSDLETSVTSFTTAKSSLNTAKELFTLETSNYELLQQQYRTGQVNYLNLISGLDSLISAQSAFHRSYHLVLQEQASVLALQGKLDEFLKQQ